MQDHAKPHTSNSTQKWLRANVPDFFDKESWPAKTPEANIIKNIWTFLQERVNKKKFKTAAGLKRALLSEWSNIPKQMLHSLVGSMNSRLDAIINARGGAIHK